MSTRLSLTGLSPSLAGFPKTVLLSSLNQFRGPNPRMHAPWFGLFRFRSPLLSESHVVFSSSGYLDVSVHRVPFLNLWIGLRIPEVYSGGFPHSEISGSMGICPSPKLFAAYHVLHRLLVPRHPPYALISITKRFGSTGMDLPLHMHSVACVGNRPIVLLRFSSKDSIESSLMFVNNITSDVLIYKIFLSSIDFLCMQFSRYIRFHMKPSGEYESRTRDLLLARQALSQLS